MTAADLSQANTQILSSIRVSPSILLEDAPAASPSSPPARCHTADILRAEWYFGEPWYRPLALDALCYHMAHCLRCLARSAWYTEAARVAVMPEIAEQEIENA